MESKKTIFLSYCWKDENIANDIDDYMNSIGIKLIRDKRDVKYKDSFKVFMKSIKNTDFVIMIISENYLKSSNCMYEVLETIKDDKYRDRILPIVLESSNVFMVKEWINYIQYWEDKCNSLKNELESLNITNLSGIIDELKILREIAMNIGGFLSVLKDMNCLSLDENKENKYKDILEVIGDGLLDKPVRVEEVLKTLAFENGYVPNDKYIITTCPTCGSEQNLMQASICKNGLETIYECKNGCQPIVVIGPPGTSSWEGRGYRIKENVIRNTKDLLVKVANDGKSILIPGSPNALAKRKHI
ncbi:toll/interleukin-1 receptor domain-containing protein [Clostridium diolis]|uniref:toll/interleukin-1 receptor domain-containing protein n=1 Tax=Clostridium diolis TaxID=223919 RepID=UPI003AF4B4AB